MRGSSPLYAQIAERLRRDVAGLQAGSRVASEPELARSWSVSRFTVTRAIETLVDEGLLVRRQGAGTFVAQAPLRRVPGYLLSFTEAVLAAGHTTSHRLLAYGPAESTAEDTLGTTAPDLPFAPGEPLLHLDRLRLVDGVAVARHRSTLSAVLADRLGLSRAVAEAPGFSLYGLFRRHRLEVERADERLTARQGSPAERNLLGLGDADVVVAVTRHSFAADGTVLDCVEAVYDARRYSYEARLVRHPDLATPHQTPSTENTHASDRPGWRDVGPRLGPWTGLGERRQRR